MAIISKLSIHQFRNFNHQYLEPSKNINLFIGDNSQGKTNLIEAIYYLGHNRSFKTKNLAEVIGFNSNTFQLKAQIDTQRIKLEKSRKKTTITLNEKNINNASELIKLLPTQIITQDKGLIVNGTPKNKRSYLDWGVFHVKQKSLATFKSYNKILKNINVLLFNQKPAELDFWFLELAKISVEINQNRIDYMNELKKTAACQDLQPLSELFDYVEGFDYQLNLGWTKEVDGLDFESIYHYLIKNTRTLLKTKHLNYGSHKANIRFSLHQKAECFLSRGEQKILSIIFWLTQVLLLIQKNITPIVLIDDLSSELDNEKISLILNYLNMLNIQTFVTNINPHSGLIQQTNGAVFHIKNGKISA